MRSFKYIVQFVFFLAVVVVGIYFGNENDEPLSIMVFGNLQDPVPVWFVVLISFFVGATVAGIYFSFELIRLWAENRRLKKKIPPTSSTGSSAFRPSNTSFGGSSTLGSSNTKMSSSFNSPNYSSRPTFGSTAGPRGKLP